MVVDLAGGLVALGGSTAMFFVGVSKPHFAWKAGIYALGTGAAIRGRGQYQIWSHHRRMQRNEEYRQRWQEMDEWTRSDTVFGEFGGYERKITYIASLTVVMAGGCVLGGCCGSAGRYAAQTWRTWKQK